MHKWKKILNFVMAVALLTGTVSAGTIINADNSAATIQASAAVVTDTDGFELTDYGSYMEVTGYTGMETSIKIPSAYNQKPVTRIAAGAFADASAYAELTSIEIPETIEYIGKNAFSGCVNVTEGYLPAKFIGICMAAKEIEISENVKDVVSFEVSDSHTIKVTTDDGLASLYTEYTIDGITLADRGLAVPDAAKNLDVGNLTSASFRNFVNQHSTIEKVTVYNRESTVYYTLLPENAVVWGWLNSTAQKYAEENDRHFEPLDNEDKILNSVSVSMTYTDTDQKTKFRLRVTADTGDYSPSRTGVLVYKVTDDYNEVTAENAESILTVDSGNTHIGRAGTANSKTTVGTATEAGYGLWVRPYVQVADGRGGTVTKYGDVQFVYSEAHMLNHISLDMQTGEKMLDDNIPRMSCSLKATNFGSAGLYTRGKTGYIVDRVGAATDESSARSKLTVDADTSSGINILGKVVNNETEEVTLSVKDLGKGVWVVGYTTFTLNGHTVTKYTDPAYWASVNPFADVSVSTENSAISAIKFKMTATAQAGGLEIVETGILTNKTGVIKNSDDAQELLTLDSGFSAMQKFSDAGAEQCIVNMTDIGNGIWYVGYTTVKTEDGQTKTIYSEPKYVYSDIQTEGTNISVTVSELSSGKFRFTALARTEGETPVKAGIIVNRSGKLTDEKTAKEKLTLDSGFSSNETRSTTDEQHLKSFILDVTDKSNGIWYVGYIVTEDANGQQTTHYTEPIYIHDQNDVIKANMALNMTTAKDASGKQNFYLSAITGDYAPSAIGFIVNRNGKVTTENASQYLSLEDETLDKSNILEKAVLKDTTGLSNCSVSVKSKGSGIWVVGYVTVNANGTEITKYTAPVYIPES